MNNIAKRNYLFMEVLSYLNYKEIALIRQLSKDYKKKIDNISIWESMLKRDLPNLYFITSINSTVALQILSSYTKSKVLDYKDSLIIGAIGSLGKLEYDINESSYLSQAGFLGSIKDYVSSKGLRKICLVSIPNVEFAVCQLRLISTFLLLSDCQGEWQEKLGGNIQKFESFGVTKIVVAVNSNQKNEFLNEVSKKYQVILVNELTKDNVIKCLIALDTTHYNNEAINKWCFGYSSVPNENKEESKPKKKCSVF